MNRLATALLIALLSQPAVAATYNPEHVAVVDADAVRQAASPEAVRESAYLKGLWTPTQAQADAAYAAFARMHTDPKLLTSSPWASSAQLTDHLDDYRITISGLTAQAGSDAKINGRPGQRMIDVHGMCAKDAGEHWRSRGLPIITDMGLCAFSARYDPQADRIIFFYFDGN